MTKKQIMADLKEIRYYYSRKETFDEVENELGANAIVDKVKKYNAVMKSAPIKIYDVYIELYMRNNTQESLADKWGYSTQYIKMLNARLYQFLEQNLSD